MLLYCSNAVAPSRHSAASRIWTATGPSVLGPWDIASAQPFDHPSLYAPRLVRDHNGAWVLVGFIDQVDGHFVGELADPIAIRHSGNARLIMRDIPIGERDVNDSASPVTL